MLYLLFDEILPSDEPQIIDCAFSLLFLNYVFRTFEEKVFFKVSICNI